MDSRFRSDMSLNNNVSITLDLAMQLSRDQMPEESQRLPRILLLPIGTKAGNRSYTKVKSVLQV